MEDPFSQIQSHISIFFCDMYFDKKELMVMCKCSVYYASIMLNVFRHLLCSLLCQHNWQVPRVRRAGDISLVWHNGKILYLHVGWIELFMMTSIIVS